MSGGRYDYAYCKVEDFAFRMKTHETGSDLERKAFRKLLVAVAKAMRDIELEDSGDGADVHNSIRACFRDKEFSARMLIEAIHDARKIHAELGKLLEASNA